MPLYELFCLFQFQLLWCVFWWKFVYIQSLPKRKNRDIHRIYSLYAICIWINIICQEITRREAKMKRNTYTILRYMNDIFLIIWMIFKLNFAVRFACLFDAYKTRNTFINRLTNWRDRTRSKLVEIFVLCGFII